MFIPPIFVNKGSLKCRPIPPFVARKRLGKHVPAARNTRNNRRTARHVCLWVCLYIPLSLLGNNSVNTSPRQRRIVGDVVFYAVSVVSKENRRLVLTRTSCFHCYSNIQEVRSAISLTCFIWILVSRPEERTSIEGVWQQGTEKRKQGWNRNALTTTNRSRRIGLRAGGVYSMHVNWDYKIFIGNDERKRLVGWPKSRLEDNIKMDLKYIKFKDVGSGLMCFGVRINEGI
jgi:hypothetical protein